jgi:succinate dehydrogenase / fumarate reductase cytochrome b subunit
VPYKANKDYLTKFSDWLTAQGTGRDGDGNDYPNANNFSAAAGHTYYETERRRIQTMRDLARFVNRDALHQAYFNAALQLGNLSAKADPGNPYGLSKRQIPFGPLGGPHLLALVSEVASRALQVVWHQKWTHRRLRPEAYGGLLHGPLNEIIWGARAVLLSAVILHVIAAYQLTRAAAAARPIGYVERRPQVSTFASQLMRWGGVLLLVFIVFHILHFTVGTVHPDYVEGDIYRNVTVGFQPQPWVAGFYVIAMVSLGFHLYHGVWSSVRSLGLAQPSASPLKRRVAMVLSIVVATGFALVPLAVVTGVIK